MCGRRGLRPLLVLTLLLCLGTRRLLASRDPSPQSRSDLIIAPDLRDHRHFRIIDLTVNLVSRLLLRDLAVNSDA